MEGGAPTLPVLSPAHPDFSRKVLGKDSPHFKGHQTVPRPDTRAVPNPVFPQSPWGLEEVAPCPDGSEPRPPLPAVCLGDATGGAEHSASNVPVCKTPCTGIKEMKSPFPTEAVF